MATSESQALGDCGVKAASYVVEICEPVVFDRIARTPGTVFMSGGARSCDHPGSSDDSAQHVQARYTPQGGHGTLCRHKASRRRRGKPEDHTCELTSTPPMRGCLRAAHGLNARSVETARLFAGSAHRGVSPLGSCPEAELLLLQSSPRR